MPNEHVASLEILPKGRLLKIINEKIISERDKKRILDIEREVLGKRRALVSLNKDDLLKIISASHLVSTAEAQQLKEDQLYGGTAQLRLLELKNPPSEEHLIKWLTTKQTELQEFLNASLKTDSSIKNIKCKDVLQGDSLKFQSAFLEQPFEFSKRIDYIDPQKRQVASVYGLKFGYFLFVKVNPVFILINCPDKELSDGILNFFRTSLGRDTLSYSIPNDFSDSFWEPKNLVAADNEEMDRHSNRSSTQRMSDKDLSSKSDFRESETHKIRKKSTYNVELGGIGRKFIKIDNINGTISIRGAFSREQLNAFIAHFIQRFIQYLRTQQKYSPSIRLRSKTYFSWESLRIFSKNKQKMLADIFPTLVDLIVRGSGSENMKTSASSILDDLGSLFVRQIKGNCPACSESQIYHNKCNSHDIDLDGERLKCGTCSLPIELNEVVCSHGHDSHYENISELIRLYPTDEFLYYATVINSEFSLGYNRPSFENFYISGNKIFYHKVSDKSRFTLSDIDDFKEISEIVLSTGEVTALSQKLGHLPEKCHKHGVDSCKKCKNSPQGDCLVRVCGKALNTDFLHHSGHEFADLLFHVTFEGNQYLVAGIVKAQKGSTLTTADNRGVMEQTISLANDARCSFIALISSAQVNNDLLAHLHKTVQNAGKKFLFIGNDDVLKLLSFYTRNNLYVKI